MEVTDARRIEVVDQSQVSEARRRIIELCTEQGINQKTIDRVALVSTEMATNLVKHSTGGIMIAQGFSIANNLGLEIFAIDKGPGMDNIELCAKDGYSSAGSLGTGIGAISRLSNSMDISSSRSRGTVIQSRIWESAPVSVDNNYAGFAMPLCGERLSGDKWAACQIAGGLYCLLVDGLGHGFEASEAAQLAVTGFKENLSLEPEAMMQMLHERLRGSRGAVGALAKIDFRECKLDFVGLGNITGLLVNDSRVKHLTSMNGTMGHEARKILGACHPWNSQSLLLMHSDGLSTKVAQDLALTSNTNISVSLIAAGLLSRHFGSTDDVSLLLAKEAVS